MSKLEFHRGGTTGWYQHIDKVRELTNERKAAVLYGSNFSIGMNFFFKAVQAVAPVLKHDYRGSIVERHHIHKKDKPSGKAVTIRSFWSQIPAKKLKLPPSGKGNRGHDLVMLIQPMTRFCLPTTRSRASALPKAQSAPPSGSRARPGFMVSRKSSISSKHLVIADCAAFPK